MKIRKLLSLLLALTMLLSVAGVASAETVVTDLPRNETLYFGGQQWGTVNSWNPVGTNQNNAMGTTTNPSGSRTIMFETLYMYNLLDGSMTPLLADGDPVWAEDLTSVTVTLNDAAMWSDGTDVTSADVVRTWEISTMLNNPIGANYGPFIESVEAVDDLTVTVNLTTNEEGQPVNPLKVEDYLVGALVAQAAWLDTLEERNGGDTTAMLNDVAEDAPYTGPYGLYISNDQLVAFVRNDNYWGQDESMWGSLPVPKYIAHTIYADNAQTEVAFRQGEIDVGQIFVPNVQDLWEEEGLPVSGYMMEEPYGICLTMPTAWYNLNNPVLQDATLRKAIAIAVDYDAIIENAITNQSPTFEEVPRSCMNPTEVEQALYDHEAVADLQWTGNDIEGAIAMLEEAGYVDVDGDGYRETPDGEKITLTAVCPNGWTDWQAAIELVAAAGQNIGIEITTLYPESSTYSTVYSNPNQTEYDIFMQSPDGAGPSQPWGRIRQFMSSDFVGLENNFSGNYGQYTNERIDEILALIPITTDEEELTALYTEAVEIYLTEVPSFSLMYRPQFFHFVNESVWTNFPYQDDGTNIPPTDCTDGYGIAALYNLQLVEG